MNETLITIVGWVLVITAFAVSVWAEYYRAKMIKLERRRNYLLSTIK